MRSNYWEELDMNDEIQSFHEEECKKIGIPDWISDLSCHFCHEELPLRSVRSIRLCMNTRNFGDIAVEICCSSCRQMDSYYFDVGIENMEDFCHYLNNTKNPIKSPLIEEDMYNTSDNKIVNKIMISKNKGRSDDNI